MKTRKPSISGFSLVEVTVALAIISFCLVTILGLLAVGMNSTHISTTQTAATNILTAVAADLEATPNITPYDLLKRAKGTVLQKSSIYGINLIAVPASGIGASATQKIYLREDGQVLTSATGAFYQLNVWVNTATATQQETFVRLLISWPAASPYASAQGYVENVIAINRT